MHIGVIGSRGAGASFIIDQMAQLLSRSGKRVHVYDASDSMTLYKKYALKKQQQAQVFAEPCEGYVVSRELGKEEYIFVDAGQEDVAGQYDMILVVSDLDYYKYLDIVEFMKAKPDIPCHLIVSKYIHGHMKPETMTLETENRYQEIHLIDYDAKTQDIELCSRLTGEAAFFKLSRHTQKQVYAICKKLFELKENLRRLKNAK